MADLGKAYVQIVPSAKGIGSTIQKALGDEVGPASEAAGKKSGSGFASGFGTAAKAIGAVALASLGAAAAGVGKLVKDSVSEFANFEQLAGGVDTIFKRETLDEFVASAKEAGMSVREATEEYRTMEQAADTVMKNAANAFKTSGLSANEYMETVTSFSASLLQSLNGDTAKAAQVADMAIIDMSDNANKMGTSMEAIQNAYQGFAKQNYTMLDNLKLGYGGTKTEMERLLADAQALSGVEYDIDSYADIVEAIHVVQDEMSITGTTAKEASETISGSLAATGAAWQNLVTGIADDNADVGQLLNNFVDSLLTAADNVIPRVEQALLGIGELVPKLGPIIEQELPGLIQRVLPSLVDGVMSLAVSLSTVLPGIAETLVNVLVPAITQNAPALLRAALDLIMALVTSLLSPENVTMLVNCAYEIVTELANWLAENAGLLIGAAIDLIIALATALLAPENISNLIDAAINLLLSLAEALIDNIDTLIACIPDLIMALVTGIIENAPKLLMAAGDLIFALMRGLVQAGASLLQAGMDIVNKIGQGIADWLGKLPEKGREIIDSVKNGLMERIEAAKQWGADLINNFINGIKQKWEDLKQWVSNIADTVKSFLGFSEPEEGPLSNFHTFAPDMMDLYAKGIEENKNKVYDALMGAAGDFETAISPTFSAEESDNAPAAGGITIIVNPSAGMDETALAQKIGDVIRQQVIGRGTVFA